MSAIVGIVEARPETIVDDYRRVMQLGGLTRPPEGDGPTLVRLAGGGDPGFASPPWQSLAVRQVWDLGHGQVTELACSGSLPGAAGAKDRGPSGESMLLLTVPVVEARWGIRSAVACWAGVLGFPERGSSSDPGALAAAIAANEVVRPGVVCDGTLWGVKGGTFHKDFLQRNILLAGTDPVAVDSVAMQLAGMMPEDFPWMQHLEKQGVGTADPAGITVRGNTGRMADHFAGAFWAGPGRSGQALGPRSQEFFWRLVRRRRILQRYRDSAWGRLAESLEIR